ncbi:MAG: hypothetical protein KGH98_00610 [Candidatus Micrarchaeota archaeon]|nr:hypothetical protein [Candidatus Micrarchaeota archaeon]
MIGNIYEKSNYRLLVILPVALMLVGLYFIPHIQLDQSLRGGILVQVQTQTQYDIKALTGQVDGAIPGAQASIASSPGGIAITLAENASISQANQNLLNIGKLYDNYTNSTARLAQYLLIPASSRNSTVQQLISAERRNESSQVSMMASNLTREVSLLAPFYKPPQQANQSASSMYSTATNAYANSTAAYRSFVVSKLGGIIPLTPASYSYKEITYAEASIFQADLTQIVIVAFVLVAIVVFLIFRTPIPAFAVVFGAGNDFIVALGAMGAFGIPLGVASAGGLLMLIGYSIDTDLLSSIRILKRTEGTATGRAMATMKTGITMTAAAIISFGVLFIVSYIYFIPTYLQISGVVLAGLAADILTTWFANVPMILWYKHRKEGHR